MASLKLISRSYCHLSHEMELALVPLLAELGADVEMIDVDQNPLLEEKYGEYVPVLMHGDVELCRFVLDVSKVRDYLRFLR